MRRTLPIVLAALALAAPVAFAGGSPVNAAFTKTAHAPSERVAFSGTITLAGQAVPFTATGAVDNRTKSAHLFLDLSKLAAAAGGAANASALRAEEILDGRALVLYLKFPLLTRLSGTAKPWVKLDLGAAAKQQGIDLGSLLQADPSQQLQLLCGVTGAAASRGSATVRGVRTTHYRVTLDYAKAATCAPAAMRPTLQKLVPTIQNAHSVPLDLYVGADGYIHRESFAYTMRTNGKLARASFVVDLYDFGAPVTIQAPPASQTADLSSLTQPKPKPKGA